MIKVPTVSIVLTSYNQMHNLECAFRSLLNQTYKDLEIIIVDDCSTDGVSRKYIESIAAQYPALVRAYFQEKNLGIARNKNFGFKLARGRYITYLDGDDFYLPDKIEREVDLFNSDPTIDVVYSNFSIQDYDGKFLGNWADETGAPEGFIFDAVFSREFPQNMLFRCELLKSEVLKGIGYYDESIVAYHDWDSRIRYSKFCKIKYTGNIGSVYVQDPAGISKTKKQLFLMTELERVYEKNKPLLASLPDVKRSRIKRIFKEKLLIGLIVHSDSMLLFWKSAFLYMCLKPLRIKFIVRQVYGRAKQLLMQ